MYDLLKVWANPKTSTVVNITTGHKGSEVRYHIGRAVMVTIKKTADLFE
jgi:hypothetical protein